MVELPYGKQHDKDGNYRKRTKSWCPDHGIRLHSGTFVYWNGAALVNKSRLRNFLVEQKRAEEVALADDGKAESYRLGYEMSEDALSWNVFVGLAVAGKLREAATFLTGRSVSAEPQLYLWGKRIDVQEDVRGDFSPLKAVRGYLESGIHRFVTEPDIMLVVPRELLISIEAKFGSGNPLAYEAPTKVNAKPTSRADLLKRYLGNAKNERTRHVVHPNKIGDDFHSQLFRNVVFASEMAARDWHVVNLVSSTQRDIEVRKISARPRSPIKPAPQEPRYSFADPEPAVRCYLHPDSQHCFTYRTWEALHATLISGCPALSILDSYVRGKSAHYLPAFDLR